ncbi:MAG: aminopeptidase P family protein [Candidatus Thermoplasmatota archaeon]|nr:aminopeptidase P family protein [Candidatus Thermoplasmatota archaeon]MBS3789754.1 aminopeptidase P family protein [Candidatus Thermoplasmatota archaeon]
MSKNTDGFDHPSRIKTLREKMEEHKIDLTVLYERENVRYFTGWRQNTTSFSILFITQDDLIYFVPKLDKKAVDKECWIPTSKTYVIPEDPAKKFKDLIDNESETIQKIGIESETIFNSRLKNIEKNFDCELSDVQPIMNSMRIRKTKEEQNNIREGASALSGVMTDIIDMAQEDMMEKKLTAEAKKLFDTVGGETYSFEPFAMSGENSWLPHRTSTEKRIQKGELILIDMGLIWEGYATDITRTFVLGEPSEQQRDLFEAAYEAQKEAKKMVKPGVKAETVHEKANEIFEEYGYSEYFPHLTGHGLGLETHEDPILDKGQDIELKPGMVVTVEPGIYKEGVGGARVEDMLLVIEDGHEELTTANRMLV